MTSKTVTIGGDGGSVVITKDDEGATTSTTIAPQTGSTTVPIIVHRRHQPLDTGSFVAGLMLGLLLYFIVQSAMRWHARREAKSLARAASIGPQEDRMAAEVAALSRRTATLETIVTDPAQRTAREIEALR